MHKVGKQAIAIAVMIALLGLPLGVAASEMEERDPQVTGLKMTTDVLIARPLGIVGTVVGFGLFIISSPFSLLGGNADKAWQSLVVYPAKFTFDRPLGKFE